MKRVFYALAAAVLLISGISAYGEAVRELSDEEQLMEEMILYYGGYGEEAEEEIDELLDELKETNSGQGELWDDIMDYWEFVDTDMVINMEKLPESLPNDDSFALVILGGALNDDGSMRDELIGRLHVGLDCAKQYPNAYVVCTGGGTAKENKDVTEAGQMGAWLMENGLEEDRLILENKSRSTIENAQFTLDILRKEYPQINSIAIVSSDYHIARGSLLFEAISLMMADEEQGPEVHVISNCAYPVLDKDYTEEYLRRWVMYNLLQLIGDRDLARLYIEEPENFPWPELAGRDDAAA